LDEQIIHDLVRLYTQVAPHPEAGPEERRKRANLKINFGADRPLLGVEDYDALLMGWAGFVFAGNAQERTRALYTKVNDYLGYTGGQQSESRAITTVFHPLTNPKYLTDWAGMDRASGHEAAFHTAVAAPLMALRIEQKLDDAQSPQTLRDVFIKVNGGEVTSLEDGLKSALEAEDLPALLAHDQTMGSFANDVLDRFVLTAARRGYVDVIQPRPENESIHSMGGLLDTRMYMQDPTRPKRTVFVMTHGGTLPWISRQTRSYDLMAMPTIRKMLPHGDVMVVHRFSYGQTENVPPEFANIDCARPRYLWGIRSADQHMSNVATWLKASGYRKIIGVGHRIGALPLLAAAADGGGYDQIFLFDPWRTVRTQICQPDELQRALKELADQTKAPVHVVAGIWDHLYLLKADAEGKPLDMRQRMGAIFGNRLTWVAADTLPVWDVYSHTAEQYPDLWWPEVEKRLQK
jgi:pimeloyl-ACP methyl ester carboxylesterase